MNSQEVARYLQDHPEFFEEYAELLSTINIPHPHGGRAIPLSERQILSLRERCRTLEGKLRELVQFGEDNDSISDRLHRTMLGLLASQNVADLFDSLYENLQRDFAITAVTVRAWPNASQAERDEFAEVSEEARVFADSLSDAYFSAQPMFESAQWLPQPATELGSLVYLPLRAEKPFGLLVLASDDPQRFAPDQGTLYLKRLSEAVGTALRRYCEV